MLNSCKTGKKRPDDEKIWDETREEEKKPSLIIQNDGEAGERLDSFFVERWRERLFMSKGFRQEKKASSHFMLLPFNSVEKGGKKEAKQSGWNRVFGPDLLVNSCGGVQHKPKTSSFFSNINPKTKQMGAGFSCLSSIKNRMGWIGGWMTSRDFLL